MAVTFDKIISGLTCCSNIQEAWKMNLFGLLSI